ncbi:hypothetical protein AGMMS4952_26340 [Spirochaetia bacterium]|nr:hypothetical protein AGMMS4952_26340 [Spirochaetia bacterium]
MKQNRLFVLGVAIDIMTTVVLAGCSKQGGSSGGSSSGGGAARSSGRETPASDFAYDATADGAGVVITKYTGNGGKVVVPAKIEGLPVVEIRDYVFADKYSLQGGYGSENGDAITELVIPNSVVTIGDWICHGASSLTKVTLPDGLKIIPFHAFLKCSNLITINLPSSLEEIVKFAFDGCGELANLTIPDSLSEVEIGEWAFVGCGKLPLAVRAKLKELGYTGRF